MFENPHAVIEGQYIAYYRVSIPQGGRYGFSLEAQQAAVLTHLKGGAWRLLDAFTEVRSGKRADRPELARALAACQQTGATLMIAKLDRLIRSATFLASLMESGVEFVACDNPHVSRLTIHTLAAAAEHGSEAISKRAKEALAVAKARGKRLGGYRGSLPDGRLGAVAMRSKADAFATRLAPLMADMKQRGLSLHQMAAELRANSIETARGGSWTATTVRRVLARALTGWGPARPSPL
jgi:DNA invertase Pin-like site-specific DNA recombinase